MVILHRTGNELMVVPHQTGGVMKMSLEDLIRRTGSETLRMFLEDWTRQTGSETLLMSPEDWTRQTGNETL